MARGIFEKFGRFVDRHLLSVSLVVSAVGLTFAGTLIDWMLDTGNTVSVRLGSGVGLALTAGAVVHGTFRQGSLERLASNLESERDSLRALVASFGNDYFDIWNKRLQTLSAELGFDGRDRISVYRFRNDAFTMVGRYSILPDLNKAGRSIYPSDQGVIGKAWKSGEGKCIAHDLPSPETAWDEYLKRSFEDWNMDSETVAAMQMKPRSVAAFTLSDEQKTQRNAMIVFESTEAGRFEGMNLERKVFGRAGQDIVHLLALMRDREPSLDYAHKKGF